MTAPPSASPVWRYHFTDMRRGIYLAALPLVGAAFTDVLGGGGGGEGVVPLASPQVRSRDPWAATTPRRTVCWAERLTLDPSTGRAVDSHMMWAGPVLTRKRSRSGRSLSLGMISWAGYWARRLIRLNGTFTQQDRFTIARWLFQQAQYGDGVATTWWGTISALAGIDAGNLSGQLMDRAYLASDLKPVLEAVTQLAGAGDGFDWQFRPARNPSAVGGQQFTATLDLGYPRLGRVAPPDLVWSSKRNRSRAGYLLDYEVLEDGSAVDNHMVGMGSGSGPTQLRADVTAAMVGRDEDAYGYPLWESSIGSSTNDLKTQAAVDAHARGAMFAGLASEYLISNATVRGDLAPVVTSYAPGDDVTLNIADPYSPGQVDVTAKLLGRRITPAENGRTEKVVMTLQPTPVGLAA